MQSFKVDQLQVQIYPDRRSMGEQAAQDVAREMMECIARQGVVRMTFAAAPSQNEFLQTLTQISLDWSKVIAFHLDEYLGLPAKAPQRFSQFLRDNLFEKVDPGQVYYLDGGGSPAQEAKRYGDLLKANPLDIACIGIGENGHIAFNDPPVADFHDPEAVKVVELEDRCRQQQVNDGCFPRLDAVPTHALTMTIPAILAAKKVYCMVPGPTKALAVAQTLQGEISTQCPASILRRHDQATLYIDVAAGAGLNR